MKKRSAEHDEEKEKMRKEKKIREKEKKTEKKKKRRKKKNDFKSLVIHHFRSFNTNNTSFNAKESS
jgi:hypothetical protein